MSSCFVTQAGLLLLCSVLVLCEPLKSPEKCSRIKNPLDVYPANQTAYMESLLKCAMYCENSTTPMSFFSFQNQVCKLYSKYPSFTDSPNEIYCFPSPVQRRYCLVKQNLTFTQALSFCPRFHMNLLSLETAVENDWFFTFYKKLACTHSSLAPYNCNGTVLASGASTTGALGTWMWEGSNTTIQLNNWMSGYPLLSNTSVALLVKVEGNLTTNQAWWSQQDQLVTSSFFCEFDDFWI